MVTLSSDAAATAASLVGTILLLNVFGALLALYPRGSRPGEERGTLKQSGIQVRPRTGSFSCFKGRMWAQWAEPCARTHRTDVGNAAGEETRRKAIFVYRKQGFLSLSLSLSPSLARLTAASRLRGQA